MDRETQRADRCGERRRSKKSAANRVVKGQSDVYLRQGSPYWQISYWNGWQQIRETSGTTDHGEAVRTLQRKLGGLAVGKSAGAGRIRVAALLQLVIDDYRRQDRADLCEAEQRINRLLKPHFGHLRASAFNTKAVNEYIASRRKDGIKALKEDNVREGFLEPDKYRLVLDALTDEIKPLFVIAYHLGMRTGELLALKRSWVDLHEGLIYGMAA